MAETEPGALATGLQYDLNTETRGHGYSGVQMNATLEDGSAGIPARIERESAKTEKRRNSMLSYGASSLSVLRHA